MTARERLSVHVRKISGYEGITEGQAHVLRAAADEMDALTALLQAAQATIAEARKIIPGIRHRDFEELAEAESRWSVAYSRTDMSALDAVKAGAWDECLDAIEQHELNTEQARAGNPYRVASIEQEGAE